MGLFKPSARKVVEEIFKGFTPEERALLDSKECAVPNMYTRLINVYCKAFKAKYSLKMSKKLAEIYIFAFRDEIKDPKVQNMIFKSFIEDLLEK